MRISRSDHERTSGQWSSPKPRRCAVSRAGNGAARSSTTSSSPRADEPVDEVVDDRRDHRLESLHRLRREAAGDERALLVVRGIVLGDHVLFLRRDP